MNSKDDKGQGSIGWLIDVAASMTTLSSWNCSLRPVSVGGFDLAQSVLGQ